MFSGAAGQSNLVDPLGIAMQQPGLLVIARTGDDFARGIDPVGKSAAGGGSDGMVAAPDHAIPAETLDHMLDIGPQRCRSPD